MNNIATNETVSIVERFFGKAAGRKVQSLCKEIYFSKINDGVENDRALKKLYSIAKRSNVRIEWYGRKIPCQPERFDIVRKGTSIGRIHY